MTVETLRSGDTGYDVEELRHGVIRNGAQVWQQKHHSSKQLTHHQLNKCRPEAG